jgi:hypothetical protein
VVLFDFQPVSVKLDVIASLLPGFVPQEGASSDLGGEGAGNGLGGGTGGGTGGGQSVELNIDPLLIALLKKIPDAIKEWPAPQRVRLFRTFAMNVSQIYDGDDNPVEMKIEETKEAAN